MPASRNSRDSFPEADKGNVALIFALILPLMLIMMAFSVDLGSLSVQKRKLQANTDIAAVIAAQEIDNYRAAALANLGLNSLGDLELEDSGLHAHDRKPVEAGTTAVTITAGVYRPDPGAAPHERFTAGAQPYNAVKVSARHQGELHIASSFFNAPEVSASSVAYASEMAAFSVGSRLARIEGGLVNDFLNSLFGTSLSLDVMDYEALVDGQVSLLPALENLASEADIEAATYEDVLNSNVTLAQLAEAMATVPGASRDTRAALRLIAADTGAANLVLRLSESIELGNMAHAHLGDTAQTSQLSVDAMPFLMAAAGIGTETHQVELDLGTAIPGVAAATAFLQIGERPQRSPWLSVSDEGVTLRTAQTRLLVMLEIGGEGVLSGVQVTLPLYVEVAHASARLEDVSCPAGRADRATVDLAVRPGIASLRIAGLGDNWMEAYPHSLNFQRARLVDAPLLDIYGEAHVYVGGRYYRQVSFSASEIAAAETKTVSTRRAVSSVTESVLRDLSVTVYSSGLSLTSPYLMRDAVAATILPVADDLDEAVFSLLDVLGVSLGQADVTVHGVHCRQSVLVQ